MNESEGITIAFKYCEVNIVIALVLQKVSQFVL